MDGEILFTRTTIGLKPQLLELWCACFGEDEGYARLFLENRFTPNVGFVALCGEVLAGMLFALPVTICDNGEEYNAAYIYGVATALEFRGRGISTQLLNYAHEQLKGEGKQLSLLVPAGKELFDFYEKRGFSNTIDILEYRHTAGAGKAALQKTSLLLQRQRRDCFFSACSSFVKWDELALDYVDKELRYLGGETFSFLECGQEGYAVCYLEGDAVVIKEWAASELYTQVLDEIARRFDKKEVLVRLSRITHAPLAVSRRFAMSYSYLPERKKQIGAGAYLSLVLD